MVSLQHQYTFDKNVAVMFFTSSSNGDKATYATYAECCPLNFSPQEHAVGKSGNGQFRSSHPEVFLSKVVLRICSTGEQENTNAEVWSQ